MFVSVAKANITLVGFAAATLLLRPNGYDLLVHIGTSIFAFFLVIISIIYTGHISAKFKTVHDSVARLSPDVSGDLRSLGLDEASLLRLARSARFSAYAVFGAAYVVMGTTWTAFLVKKCELGEPQVCVPMKWLTCAAGLLGILIALIVLFFVAHWALRIHCYLPPKTRLAA